MKFKYSMFLLGLTISFSVFSNGNSTFPILMSYNIYMLDKKLTDTQQIKRANLLNKSDFFNNIDIIAFNEVFDNDSSQIITDGLTKKGFSYFTPVLGRQIIGWDSTEGNWSDSIPEDGGVLIMSKYPIEYKAQYIFSNGCGADAMSQKGFIHAKIRKDNVVFNIIATHTQADDNSCSISGLTPEEIRNQQFAEIRNYIIDKKIPSNEMVVITGDLNVNKGSLEFKRMIELLNVSEPDSYAGADFSWDPNINTLASKSFPDLNGQLLDYILVDKDHLQPPYWHNQVLDMESPRITLSGTIENYYAYDYSDHFPVTAFVYADEKTPTKSFRVNNSPYNAVSLQHVETKQYVLADPNNADGWLKVGEPATSSEGEFKIDNWIPKNATCLHDGDYVRLSRTDKFKDYYWNWNVTGYYYTKYGNASDYLRVHRIVPTTECITNDESVYLYDHSLLGNDKYLLPYNSGIASEDMPIQSNGLFTIKMPPMIYSDWSYKLRYQP